MISFWTVLWGILFLGAVIGSRFLLSLKERTALNPQTGKAGMLILVSLIPYGLMIGSIMSPATSAGLDVGTIAAVFIMVAMALAGGIIIGPIFLEQFGYIMSWVAIGAPSEKSMKEIKSFDRAMALVHKERYDEAIREYRTELEKDPTQWHGYKELADVLEKVHRRDEAAVELLRALPHLEEEDIEQKAVIQLRVVDLYRQLDKIEHARRLLEQMEQQTWPKRIAKAIHSRQDRLQP